MKIKLRGNLENVYPENTSHTIYDELKILLDNGECRKTIYKSKDWTENLSLKLLENINNSILICNTPTDEIRMRRDCNIPNYMKYNIHGYINVKNFIGMNFSSLIIDELDEFKWERLKYYLGFRVKNYVRFI